MCFNLSERSVFAAYKVCQFYLCTWSLLLLNLSCFISEYKIYDNVQLKTCVKYTECGEYSVKIGDYYNNWVVDCCEEDFCNSGNANGDL